MSLALKVFANGQLPASKATLYTCVGGSSLRIGIVNTSGTALKINLYTDTSGTSRRVIPKDMLLQPSFVFTTDYLELEDGDKVEGSAGTASAVDYVIRGILRS